MRTLLPPSASNFEDKDIESLVRGSDQEKIQAAYQLEIFAAKNDANRNAIVRYTVYVLLHRTQYYYLPSYLVY